MLNRRDFLKTSSMLGLSSLFSTLNANDGSSFSDYKAIVVAYMDGGNDGINTFIPIKSGTDEYGYSFYQKARETIAVDNVDFTPDLKSAMNSNGILEFNPAENNPYNTKSSGIENYCSGFYALDKGYDKNKNQLNLNFGNKIGLHAYLPELANLAQQGKVAIVQNVGNLYQPTTKSEIQNNTAVLPPFLMAHNHQTALVTNANSMELRDFGLFGKLYDEWNNINGADIYGMNISFYQNCHMLYGKRTNPTILSRQGIARIQLPNYNYQPFYDIMNFTRQDSFKRYYNKLHKHAFKTVEAVLQDWKNYDSIYDGLVDIYGKPLKNKTDDNDAFVPHGTISRWEADFLAAAKTIKIGYDRNLKRQVIYLRLASFDTHGEQKQFHGKYLRSLSTALGKFQQVIDSLGLSNNVTLVNISEFGRSIGANEDGTDHAWGNQLFVMGGAVKGGLYGEAPSLKLGGDDDMSSRGRLIPTTSIAQYYNTVLKWFGVDETLRHKLLVDLKNFDSSKHDLGFMG